MRSHAFTILTLLLAALTRAIAGGPDERLGQHLATAYPRAAAGTSAGDTGDEAVGQFIDLRTDTVQAADEEVAAFFAANTATFGNAPLASVKTFVTQYLVQT